MRSSKLYLIFILLLCLSSELMSQCIVDVKKQASPTEICISIQLDFDVNAIEKVIVSDGEQNESVYYTDNQVLNWCYKRKATTEEKHIEVYAIIAGEIRPMTPSYTQRSGNIVIVDGM